MTSRKPSAVWSFGETPRNSPKTAKKSASAASSATSAPSAIGVGLGSSRYGCGDSSSGLTPFSLASSKSCTLSFSSSIGYWYSRCLAFFASSFFLRRAANSASRAAARAAFSSSLTRSRSAFSALRCASRSALAISFIRSFSIAALASSIFLPSSLASLASSSAMALAFFSSSFSFISSAFMSSVSLSSSLFSFRCRRISSALKWLSLAFSRFSKHLMKSAMSLPVTAPSFAFSARSCLRRFCTYASRSRSIFSLNLSTSFFHAISTCLSLWSPVKTVRRSGKVVVGAPGSFRMSDADFPGPPGPAPALALAAAMAFAGLALAPFLPVSSAHFSRSSLATPAATALASAASTAARCFATLPASVASCLAAFLILSSLPLVICA